MVSTKTLSQNGGRVSISDEALVRAEEHCKQTMDYHINTMIVGKPFRYSHPCLVTGGEDGTIRVYKILNKPTKTQGFQEVSKLETKGGPVQCLCLHNATKFGSIDLIVGDSKGTLTILCNEQILNRRTLSEGRITALTVDEDFAGNLAIVVGDGEGMVTAVSPYSSLWKLRLLDACKHVHRELGVTPAVKCMLSVRLQTSAGVLTNYLLVADSCRNLFLLQNGMVVYRLQVPSVVTAMTGGYFLPSEPPLVSAPSQAFGSPRRQSSTITRQSQVALGTVEGSIYVFSDFQLQPYASVQLPVTRLVSFPNNKHPDTSDFLMCAGHFNALMVFQHQELVLRLETDDWIHTMSCIDTNSDGNREIVLGLLDNTVRTYEIVCSE